MIKKLLIRYLINFYIVFKVPIWYKLILSFVKYFLLENPFCFSIFLIFVQISILDEIEESHCISAEQLCGCGKTLLQMLFKGENDYCITQFQDAVYPSRQVTVAGSWGRLIHCIHSRRPWMLRLHSLSPVRQSRTKAQGKMLPSRVNFLTESNLIKIR